MIDWNPWLKLGIVEFAAAVPTAIWFAVRLVTRQSVPTAWLVGLGVLLLISTVTALGSQVTIVSKVSSTEETNDNAN